MSVAVTYTMIVVAFLVIFAMCMEISVRKRRSERPERSLRGGRRIDPASPTPRGRLARPDHGRRDSILLR